MKLFSAKEEYYVRLGLERDPFPDGTDNVFFTTPELNQRIELIKHLLAHSRQLLLVTAPPGGGKSMLCQYLPSVCAPNWSVHIISAEQGMTPERLAFAVINELHPEEYAASVPAVSRLHSYLEHCDRDGNLPVILIDDGQRLPMATLEFILQLNDEAYNQTRFRFVIFGTDDIVDALNDPHFQVAASGILHTLGIPPLSAEQTAAYLQHRLNAAGDCQPYPFAGQEAQDIFKVSGGLPGNISRLARQALQGPARPAPGRRRWLRYPLIATGLLLLALVLFFAANMRRGPRQAQTIAVQLPPEQPPRPAVRRPQPAVPKPPPDNAGAQTSAASPPPSPAGPAPQRTPAAEQAPAAASPAVPTSTGQPATPHAATAALGPAFSGLHGSDWIRAQAPGKYVLQVIGAREIGTLKKFLQAVPQMRNRLTVITTRKAGKPWYVLLYGLYPDRTAALRDVPNLPAAARKNRPWPRPVASVMLDLEKPR